MSWWNRAAAIAERERLYNDVARQMSSMSERAGVSLTLGQQSSVLEQFGAKKTDISGLDARATRLALENDIKNLHYSHNNMRDLAGDSGKKEQLEAWSRVVTVKRTSNDEAAQLQRFAQQHNIRMSRAEAQLILERHPKVLGRKPAETLKIIKDSKSNVFRAAKAGRAVGTRALVHSVGLGARIAGSVDGEDTALGKEDATASGRALKDAAKKASEKSKLMAREQRLIKNDAARARYRMNHVYQYGKEKGQVKPRIDERWENRANKVRQIGNKDISFRTKKTQTQKMRAKRMRSVAAERMRQKQRADTIRRLIAKNQAKAKTAKAAAEAVKEAVTAFISMITSAVTSTVAIAVVAVFGIVIVVILLVVTIVTLISALLYSPSIGDWYDPQAIKNESFVEATQDMQAKYYDDCLMMAYAMGTDIPSYADVQIDWGEVYTLWAGIVSYRSQNQMMGANISDDSSATLTPYYSGGMYIVADDTDASLFELDGDGSDDYVQDLYLAFYLMYYDMKSMDDRGNPILVDVSTGHRYLPYYPDNGTADGYDFSYYCEENGYPMKDASNGNIITNAVEKDDNGIWQIKSSSYPNLYWAWASSNSTGGLDGDAGYLCRGYPLLSVSDESFSTANPDWTEYHYLYGDVSWSGSVYPESTFPYRGIGTTLTFSAFNARNSGWCVESLYYSDGENASDKLSYAQLNTSSFGMLNGGGSNYANGLAVLQNPSSYGSWGGNTYMGTCSFEGVYLGYWTEYHSGSTTSYDYQTITYSHRTALDALTYLHNIYTACYSDYYSTHDATSRCFNKSQAYIVDSTNRMAVEAALTGYDYDAPLLILNQIFDRNEYYPWSDMTYMDSYMQHAYYTRMGYGDLPGTKDTWDCYSDIYASVSYACNQKRETSYTYPNGETLWMPPMYATDYPSEGSSGYEPAHPIPLLHWATDTEYWFGYQYYGSDDIVDNIYDSVHESQAQWPFRVNFSPVDGYDWVSGTGCMSDLGGGGTWNANAYFMYRWLTCEHGLTPQTASGVMAALFHETGFVSASTHGEDSNGCWAVGLLQWNDCSTQYTSDESNLYDCQIIQWCVNHDYDWKAAGAQLRFADDYWFDATGRSWVFDSLHNIQNGSTVVTLLSAESTYYTDPNWTQAAWGCYYWAKNVEVCTEGAGGGGLSGYGSSPAGNEGKPRMRSALTYLWYIEHSDPNYVAITYTET